MKKKLLSLVVIMALLCTVLAGCGGCTVLVTVETAPRAEWTVWGRTPAPPGKGRICIPPGQRGSILPQSPS